MKVLFYINPFIIRNNPTFYAGAIKKKLLPQAQLLKERGHEVCFFISQFYADLIRSHLPQCHLYLIEHRDLISIFGSSGNVEHKLYRDSHINFSSSFSKFLEPKLPKNIDLVISWETPSGFLRNLYPSARIVHEMPGFLSRTPFPELITLDVEGLFNESMLARYVEDIRQQTPDIRALNLLSTIRSEMLGFISENTPFSRAGLDPHGRFKKLILLPLQVTDQYAFQADSNFKSQMDLLLEVLGSVPESIGVVVTQYISRTSAEKVIDLESYQHLIAAYPNLIFDPKFDQLDNVSQYILPLVDAVVTVNSSLGIQALLWGKSLITLGDSHLKSLATHISIANYVNMVFGGIESAVDCDRILAWIFTHHQPLVSKVVNDGEFLERWLMSLPADGNLSKLPNFFDLDENYAVEFRLGGKYERANHSLSGAFDNSGNNLLITNFRKKIEEINPSLISFDIFDTLVDRSVEQPTFVFQMIEAEVERISKGAISNFSSLRRQVELSLRKSISMSSTRQEISLAEIYDEIMARFNLSSEIRNAICELEVSEEIKTLRRREAGWRMFKAAKASGCRIILISDMYLPEETVRLILESNGYPKDLSLYLSSSHGLRKHECDLFSYVQSVENIGVEKWLHVGDNQHGDVDVPQKLGISTFKLPSAYHIICHNKKLAPILKEDRSSRTAAESAIYGLIQRRYFDDPFRAYQNSTHFGGNPFTFGYVGLGSLFFGFLHWVMVQARRDGVDKLLFLSRDGKVLWRMAHILFPQSEGWPAISYAMSSRRAARVASLYTVADIAKLINSSISDTTLNEIFIKKLGISLAESDDGLIISCGFESRNDSVNAAKRECLLQLALSLADRILENAANERKLLASYYRELGVIPGARIGIVDIGYAGTMQVAIEKITGVKNIAGYYYITFESALEISHLTGHMRGYAGDFVKPKIHRDPICKNGFFYEMLFCSDDSSFLHFREGRFGIEACFDLVPEDGVRRHIIQKLHDGAVVFARDLKAAFGHRLSNFSMNSVTASRLLNDFMASPSGLDVGIFEGCLFDDGFSGSKVRYIVPPRNLISQNSNFLACAIWKEGTLVFSRRSDIFKKNESKNKSHTLQLSENIHKFNKVLSIFNRIERLITHKIVSSDRKLSKYERDRKSFFSDSSNWLVQLYWRILGCHLVK